VKALCVSLVLLISSTPGFAASAADDFGPKRWPTEPRLTVDADPAVCKLALAKYTKAFSSTTTDLDPSTAISEPSLQMQPIETGRESSSTLERVDLDLDSDGHKEVIVYRIGEHSWRGSWHYAYVFPSASAFEAARTQVVDEWLQLPDFQYPDPRIPQLGAQVYFPSALTGKDKQSDTGNVWADHALFGFSKKYYFVNGTTTFDRLKSQVVRVFRLRASGHVEVACEIEQHGNDAAYKAFQRLPAIASLLEIIRRIGAGGADTGNMHSAVVHDFQATAAETRAASRPWATSAAAAVMRMDPEGSYYYRFDERMKAFLEAWSLEEPWNRREYQTLLELIEPAAASYARYLEAAFGVSADQAGVDSVGVIEALIGDRILVPSQYSVDATAMYFPTTALHRAIMARDRVAFEAALAHPEANPTRGPRLPDRPVGQIVSESLSNAVEWPYALDRLLAAGADPNYANQFGKTPLMVAAHLDRIDSVRRLLKAGAKVDAVTITVSQDWMEGPKRTARTALMYAAENAGPTVIEALLKAGANADARDSEGNGVDFYLTGNPRLSATERASGVRGLPKIAGRFAGPSFDCAKAHTAAERSICASEVLRILDTQIARAFESVHGEQGPAALQEQRAWLRTRDQSCSAATDADCLADLMRTHLRYLHKRLAERAAPMLAAKATQ